MPKGRRRRPAIWLGAAETTRSSHLVSDCSGTVNPVPPAAGRESTRIGDFWLDARLGAREAGVVFVAHADDEPAVMVLVLAEGAAHDPAARDRLAGEVNKLHAESVVARGGDGQDDGRLGHKYRSEADDPVAAGDRPTAPWVALAYDGSPEAVAEADRLLRSVDLVEHSDAGPSSRTGLSAASGSTTHVRALGGSGRRPGPDDTTVQVGYRSRPRGC